MTVTVSGKLYAKGMQWAVVCMGTMLLLIVLSTMCREASATELNEQKRKPVVRINKMVLTEADLDDAMQRVLPSAIFHGGITPAKRQEYRPQGVELMVEDELYYQYGLGLKMKPDKSAVKEAVKKMQDRFGSKKALVAVLAKAGYTLDEYRQRVGRNQVISLVKQHEINDKAEVTDAEVATFFEENKGLYVRPESRHVFHILVKVPPGATAEQWEEGRVRAEGLRKMIVEDGKDFRDVAWDHSEGPFRVKSGDMGLLHRGRMDPTLEEATWNLKENEVSEPIRTIYGFHIIKVAQIKAPEQLSFDEVKAQIKTILRKDRSEALTKALLSSMRAASEIEIFSDEPVGN